MKIEMISEFNSLVMKNILPVEKKDIQTSENGTPASCRRMKEKLSKQRCTNVGERDRSAGIPARIFQSEKRIFTQLYAHAISPFSVKIK